MSTCRVGGCGKPRSRRSVGQTLCVPHQALWTLSAERVREARMHANDADWDGRSEAALADFAHRIEAEERNSK